MKKKNCLLPVIFTMTTSVFAQTSLVDGTIKGVRCHLYNEHCVTSTKDPHVALEQEFVLVSNAGDYYFLPDLSRSEKVALVNQNVRVSGEIEGKVLYVERVDLKRGEDYSTTWDRDVRDAELYSG